MRGVTILAVRDDLIARGRLFMEEVDAVEDDIDAAVQKLYQSPDLHLPTDDAAGRVRATPGHALHGPTLAGSVQSWDPAGSGRSSKSPGWSAVSR